MSEIKENVQINQHQTPSLCIECKKFFGKPEQNELCSKCYKESSFFNPIQSLEQQIDSLKLIENNQQQKHEDKSKCFNCQKKIGILGFDCKCNATFCKFCRMPEKHNCDFDYKKKHQEILNKANPKIQYSQFEQI